MYPILILILTIFLYLFWIIFPIITIIQCWLVKEYTAFIKILWTVFIVLTWPFLTIGSFVFSLFKYKGWRKIIPVIIITPLLISVFSLSFNFDKVFSFTERIMNESLQADIETTISDPAMRHKIKSDLQILKIEDEKSGGSNITKQGLSKSFSLNFLLNFLTQDDLSEEEFIMWNELFSKRDELTSEQIFMYVQKITHENTVDAINEKIENDGTLEVLESKEPPQQPAPNIQFPPG